jgi:hypothetical protein
VQGADRQPDQPEDVAGTEPVATPGRTLELDHAPLHDDEGVVPFGLDVPTRPIRVDPHHPPFEAHDASGDFASPLNSSVAQT